MNIARRDSDVLPRFLHGMAGQEWQVLDAGHKAVEMNMRRKTVVVSCTLGRMAVIETLFVEVSMVMRMIVVHINRRQTLGRYEAKRHRGCRENHDTPVKTMLEIH